MYALSTDLLISGWPVGLTQTPQHKYPWAPSTSSTHTHTHTHTHTLSPWIMQSKQLASQQGGSAVWHWGTFCSILKSQNVLTWTHTNCSGYRADTRLWYVLTFMLFATQIFSPSVYPCKCKTFVTSMYCFAEVTTEVWMSTSLGPSSSGLVLAMSGLLAAQLTELTAAKGYSDEILTSVCFEYEFDR